MTPTIKIADLKHRVRLEQPVRLSDSGGGSSVTWALVGEFWAAVVPRSGREQFEADALSGETLHTVYCRYRDDVHSQYRLVIGERILEIRSVLEMDDAKKFLELRCEEVVV